MDRNDSTLSSGMSNTSEPDTKGQLEKTWLRPRRAWRFAHLENLLKSFSPGERLALYVLSCVLGLSVLILLAGLNKAISVTVPSHGGTLTEGETSPARFINPVLAVSQADQDLTELVYSGLLRAQPDGTFVADLADRYSISPDGTTYTFHIRTNATFHDGSPVTSADVLYTVSLAQNPDIKSSHRADWDGVVVSAPDAHTVIFTLPHAYAPFLEDVTLGILPKHLWGSLSSSDFPFSPLNTHPVGSGPYSVAHITTDQTGAATEYDLVPFSQFALGEPYISRITILFFQNQDAVIKAFDAGTIDAIAGISPAQLRTLSRTDDQIVRAPLPRVFGIFFNQNKNPALADSSARQALSAAIDKKAIVNSVLQGFASPLQGPIPPGILGDQEGAEPVPLKPVLAVQPSAATSSTTENVQAILHKGGWTFDTGKNQWTKGKLTLAMKLSTVDMPELTASANELADQWRAAGIPVDVQVYPLSEFNNSVLRPRAYEAVLFGEVVGREADFFAFWHSSQRNDPGLNLAMYANSRVDTILSNARATTDATLRRSLYQQFATILQQDNPAIFLYAPDFLYVLPRQLKGVEIGALTTPSERFLNVYQWYTDEENVWAFFTNRS